MGGCISSGNVSSEGVVSGVVVSLQSEIIRVDVKNS